MNRASFLFLYIVLFIVCSTTSSLAQEEAIALPPTLDERFSELKEKSESYNEYKVIKATELNGFWKVAQDTLTTGRKVFKETQGLLQAEKQKTTNLNSELDKTKSELETSIHNEDHMSLLGIDMKKSIYALIMWSIIVGLGVLLGLLFSRFRYSLSLEKKSKKEFDEVNEELRTSKVASLDREMKLKRELQTAINTLNDQKGKTGTRY